MTEIEKRIAKAQAPFAEKKARWNALKQVKWHLRSTSGEYVAKRQPAGVSITVATTTAKADALVFDGRDNEKMKAEHYSVIAGIRFEPVLI